MRLENINKKSVWVALISFAILIAKTYKLFEVPENFNTITDTFLALLTTLGIIIDDIKR